MKAYTCTESGCLQPVAGRSKYCRTHGTMKAYRVTTHLVGCPDITEPEFTVEAATIREAWRIARRHCITRSRPASNRLHLRRPQP